MRTIQLIAVIFITLSFKSSTFAQSEKIVRLQGKDFYLNGTKFFPLFVNYGVVIGRTHQGSYFPSPNQKYFPSNGMEVNNQTPWADQCYDKILADFNQIKSLGFNSIRLVGMGFGTDTEADNKTETTYPAIRTYTPEYNIQLIPLTAPYTILFQCYDKIFQAAEQAGIKVQLLTGGHNISKDEYSPLYVQFLEAFATRYANNTALYSVDFMNEPGGPHGDIPLHTKGQICSMVESWHNAIKSHSNILTTVGLVSTDEIIEWDPGVLKLDFISLHIYGSIDFFRNEVKWMSENCKLPWMIGESSFMACSCTSNSPEHHIDGSELDQRVYLKAVLEATRDCGGKGYGWWQFIEGDASGGEHYGIVTKSNREPKPAAAEISLFQPFAQNTGGCPYTSSYYNYYGYSSYSLSGGVYKTGNTLIPIKGALIQSHDNNWGNFAKTFSDANGNFILYSNGPIVHLKITAYGASLNQVAYPFQNQAFILSYLTQPAENKSLTGVNLAIGQTASHEASNSIQIGNSTVNGNGTTSGGDLKLVATNSIKLNNGFKVLKGGRFKADVKSIYPSCGTTVYGLATNPNESEQEVAAEAFLSVNEFDMNSGILIAPNPSEGIFNITSEFETIEKIVVMDLTGKTILTVNPNNSAVRLDLSGQANGCYVLQIHDANQIHKKKVFLNSY